MPDEINYRFTESGIIYNFTDIFVSAENFRKPSLFVWGYSAFGRTGTNDVITRSIPVTTFAGGSNWKQVASLSHTIAVKTDGTLWVWGQNNQGQLGVNDTITRSTPVTTILGGNDWKKVAVSSSESLAIKSDGTLWTWGANYYGKLGINDSISRSTPVTTLLGGTNWNSISGGDNTVGGIKTDGTLWTWGGGFTNLGHLGNNSNINRSTPVTTFAGGNNWKQLCIGSAHVSAIKTDGTLWVWGYNLNGQLGVNIASAATSRSTPITTILGGNNWKSVANYGSSSNTVAAIKNDGTLWTWGQNTNGECGTNDAATITNRSTPVTTFAGGSNWKEVYINTQASAIKTDGSLWVWGANNLGQLGTNDITQRNTPVTTILGGNDWKSTGFSLAIEYDSDP